MFRVFDRYLLKEVINGWLAVTLFLWLILVSNRLVGYLGDAVSGDIPGNLIFKLIGLKKMWRTGITLYPHTQIGPYPDYPVTST
jgi:hypothetical protein